MPDEPSSIRMLKSKKKRLHNLDFVKKQSDEKIVEILMDFCEENKKEFEKWWKKKNK
jgi:hypothetical protein